jgi:hypothetical protein
MMRSTLLITLTVVLIAPGPGARADEPTPDQIIDKALRAHGGAEKLSGLAGFTLKDRSDYPGALSWDETLVVQIPGRYRSDRTIRSGGKSSRSLLVLDSDQGWWRSNDVVSPFPAAFVASYQKNTVPYVGPRAILKLRARQKNPACRFSTTGDCTIEGHPAVGLRMKLEGGPEETWYFDKDSGLLLQEERRVKQFEGEDEVSTILHEDYQTLDGFPIARTVTSRRDGKTTYTRQVLAFQVMTPEAGEFAKP